MRVLVTGGAGFIGSALVRQLIGHTDHHVINLDKLTYATHPQALASVAADGRYTFEQLDVSNAQALGAAFDRYRPHAVIHLAAETHVDRSISGPGAFIQTNLVGTYTLLEAARHYRDRLQEPLRSHFRLLHVSTDEVFGDLPASTPAADEESAYRPSSPYSASKAGADHLARAWSRTYGLPVIITRCSNNYGPFQHAEKLIPLTITRALLGQPLPIYGDGCQIRDWLYVDDHVRALRLVLQQGVPGQSYNIGSGVGRSTLEVVHAICQRLDVRAPQLPPGAKTHADLITHVDDRPGHDRRYALDTRKIGQALGWQARETFDSGLDKTVDWFLQHGPAQDGRP